MNEDAIELVTQALSDRLTQALASATVPGTVFIGPLDDPGASSARLILFLYRIAPNATLRNQEHRVFSSAPPPVRVFENALPLDLYYLVTVGSTGGTTTEGVLLHALGAAMQALQTDPYLTGSPVGHETVRVSLEPLTTEEASRIWALFPTANYRTSIAYLAGPVWIDPQQPKPIGAPVVIDRLRDGSKPIEAT